MNEKYLPIGSICTLKGKNKKVMISGYYSMSFNGNIKIYDYMGCFYPEGTLNGDQSVSFNHSDIEKVDFVGYKNEDCEKFLKMLNNVSDEKSEPVVTSSKDYSKLVFDENGVVVMAEPANNNVEYEFDEEGTVIGVNNPFHQEYEPKEEETKDNWDILKDYEDTETPEEELVNSSLNKIEFDENGVVIGVSGWENQEPSNEQYTFDENGVVVGVNGQSNSTSKYEFDENGVVVGVNE